MWNRRQRAHVAANLHLWTMVAQGRVVRHFVTLEEAKKAGAFPFAAGRGLVLWAVPAASGLIGERITHEIIKIERLSAKK